MAKHLIYMLSKIEYGRISKSKFLGGMDGIIENLRRDFPHVQPVRQQNSFRFELKAEGAPEVFTDTDPVLTLLSPNKTWGIRISPNFLILHTKKCEGFEDFKKRLFKVIEAVHHNFDITHISFVGMRYINSFDYNPSYEFSEYFKRMDFLQPSLGSWLKAGSNLSARYVNGTETLNVGSGVMINAPKYMPDLAELASDIDDINKINEGPAAYLDIDSFFASEDLVEFSMELISEKISILRNNANAVFNETINEV
ncbi:TIGR04255 family protein [Pseudescherichia sp.]|uniref:TIGR04255 family protein n=1 Tax=Pseudescherichia sp. TaxID=2055881 RepID=UPI002897D837|nr:TIGR04255 family protein [Pseudescherichia sp.]WPO96938.1 TIGR04255 family protein [Buttiauxella sp. HR94]